MLLCPNDALSDEGDAVILNYYKHLLDRVEVMTEGGNYTIGQIEINTPKRHVHGVETYGLNIKEKGKKDKGLFSRGYALFRWFSELLRRRSARDERGDV